MLKGMKTCKEVAEYIAYQEMAAKFTAGNSHSGYAGHGKASEHEDGLVRTV